MKAQTGQGDNSKKRRVAVVAVHGIADQQPRETARKCADLLISHKENGGEGCLWKRPYKATTERDLTIAVEEIPLTQRRKEPRSFRRLTFQPRDVECGLKAAGGKPESERWFRALRDRFDLLKLPDADRVFETVRLETGREISGEPCDVHIYEMYWADLSRLGHRIMGVFLGLFQLLFFLGVEGARTLGYARAALMQKGKHSVWWKAFGSVHALATRLLVLGVPALTFAFLGFLIFLLCYFADALGGVKSVSILPAAAVALLVGAVVYRSSVRWPAGRWWPSLLLVAGVGVGTWAAAAIIWPQHAFTIATLTLWLGFLCIFGGLMWQYQKRIQGALYWTAGIASVMTWLLLRALPFDDAGKLLSGVTEVVKLGIRWIHWPLWSLFALLSLLASLFAFLAVRRMPAEERTSASRASWTANLSVNLSGIATLAITSALWASVPQLLGYLPRRFAVEPAQKAFKELALSALPAYFPFLLGLLAIAVVIGAWAILPAAASDRALARLDRSSSGWLGQNLRWAYRVLRGSGEVVRLSVVVGMTALAALYWYRGETIAPDHLGWIFAMGAVLLIAITGSHGPFRFLALGFRAALDLALDVANWLRTDPEDQTPAGRICSRYYSLLSFLASQKYDAIVVFAHSQGTVITADLLRFLHREWKEGVAPGLEEWKNGAWPLYFFTMGSPLRQIYARRFPYRYGWAEDREIDHDWRSSEACNPSELNVRFWSNAYRSGDYGGRYLWHSDDQDSEIPWEIRDWKDKKRREICLGPGGHTRYWDGSSKEVAEELDRLIQAALDGSVPPPAIAPNAEPSPADEEREAELAPCA